MEDAGKRQQNCGEIRDSSTEEDDDTSRGDDLQDGGVFIWKENKSGFSSGEQLNLNLFRHFFKKKVNKHYCSKNYITIKRSKIILIKKCKKRI